MMRSDLRRNKGIILMKNLLLISLLLPLHSVFAVDPPVVKVDSQLLYWTAVPGATAYNIHRNTGEYIATTIHPNYAVEFAQRTGPIPYYVVSTDDGNWRDWGISNRVSVSFPPRFPSENILPVGSQLGRTSGVISSLVVTRYDRVWTNLVYSPGENFSATARCLNSEVLIGGACSYTLEGFEQAVGANMEGIEYRCTAAQTEIQITGARIKATAMCASALLP